MSERARIVIIGGGIAGVSALYHLLACGRQRADLLG